MSVSGGNTKSLAILCGVFAVSTLLLLIVYKTFPDLEENEKQYIKVPNNIEDAKVLGSILSRYKEKYYYSVLSGVFVSYVFLQTFAIPGSILLSILSGFLFPFWTALVLVCFCSATGASFCYGLSLLVGRRLIYKYFPEKVQNWSETVKKQQNNLLNYIIFLRITPFLPNWFINIASPVIGVPLLPFWLGTFVGVAAPSFLAIQAGTTLNQLTSSTEAVSWAQFCVLLALGVVSLIPILWKENIKDKFF